MKKKLGNILMISNYPSNTGYAWWLMEHFWITLTSIAKNEGSNTFLAYPKINSISDKILNSNINVVQLVLPWKNQLQKSEAIKFIRDNDISTIYFTDQPFFNTQYAFLRAAGIKNIIIHDHTPGDRPIITGFKGLLKTIRNSIAFFTADFVINVSDLMRTRSIQNGKISPKKCYSVQNGIPPVVFNNDRIQVRHELNIAEDSILAITTGRAHPYKRFNLILEAATFVKNSYPDNKILFLFVGDGPSLDALKIQAQQLEVDNCVMFLGLRNDVKDLLGASDLAIHAALGEGFSLSITEYMGAGLPVLVPDIPSVKQAIKHDENGYIYSRDSSQDMARYINKLIENKNLRDRLGQKAKSDAIEYYSLRNCTSQFNLAINNMLMRNI